MKALIFIAISLLLHSGMLLLLASWGAPKAVAPRLTAVKVQLRDVAPPPLNPGAEPQSLAKPQVNSAPKSKKKLLKPKSQPSQKKKETSQPMPQVSPTEEQVEIPIGEARGKIGGVVGGQGNALPDPADIDRSSEAQLIPSSLIKPSYTAEALEANLSGRFIVNVFVEADGTPSEAELERPIGLGMDQALIAAIMRARFIPRRDRSGNALAGWTSLTIILQLE